jgi:hypothetical protein
LVRETRVADVTPAEVAKTTAVIVLVELGLVAPEGPVFISAANVRNLTDTVASPTTALPQMRG